MRAHVMHVVVFMHSRGGGATGGGVAGVRGNELLHPVVHLLLVREALPLHLHKSVALLTSTLLTGTSYLEILGLLVLGLLGSCDDT